METLILLPAIGFYGLMALFFFLKWAEILQQDLDVSLEEYQIHLGFVAIAALFWLLILPFAYLDLLENSAQ